MARSIPARISLFGWRAITLELLAPLRVGMHPSVNGHVFVDNRVLQCDACFASCVFLLSFLFFLKLVLSD
jgi:hypothetical protein